MIIGSSVSLRAYRANVQVKTLIHENMKRNPENLKEMRIQFMIPHVTQRGKCHYHLGPPATRIPGQGPTESGPMWEWP